MKREYFRSKDSLCPPLKRLPAIQVIPLPLKKLAFSSNLLVFFRRRIHTWLHRETNEKLSFYCYSPRWITATFSTKEARIRKLRRKQQGEGQRSLSRLAWARKSKRGCREPHEASSKCHIADDNNHKCLSRNFDRQTQSTLWLKFDQRGC